MEDPFVEDCQYLTVPLGTAKSLVTYELTYSLPRGAGTDCPGGGCHTELTVEVFWEDQSQTVYGHSETVTPLSMLGWTCHANPSEMWPNAETCLKRVSQVIYVAGMTALNPATFSVYVSAGMAGSSVQEWFSISLVAGELVQLRTAAFDYQPGSDDGIDGLRIDETTAIAKPEWEAVTRETPATDGAYSERTVSPAALLTSKKLKVKATFWGSDQWESAVMKAKTQLPDGTASPYGELGPMTVEFDEFGVSGDVVFESAAASDKVGANDITLKWEIVSITSRPDAYHEQPFPLAVPGYESRRTTHRIYTVLRAPVAPMAEPWAKVLELSGAMLAPLESSATDETRVREIADAIFYSKWTGYTTRFFKPRRGYTYDPAKVCSCFVIIGEGPDQKLDQQLNLQMVLSKLELTDGGPVPLQCNDSSNLNAVLAASQGIDAKPTTILHSATNPEIKPWVSLAPTALYRSAGKSDCRIGSFSFHQVASLSNVYDTSIRAATGSEASCEAGEHFYGLTQSAYLSTVFPTQPSNLTRFVRPSVTTGNCGCDEQ